LLLKKLLNIPPDFAKSNVIEMLENENDCLAFLLNQGWGTYLLSLAAGIVHCRWRAKKSILSENYIFI